MRRLNNQSSLIDQIASTISKSSHIRDSSVRSPRELVALATSALLLGFSPQTLAQELPQLTLPVQSVGAVPDGGQRKRARIGSELSMLQNSFVRLTPEEQAQLESQPGSLISAGSVAVEAIANGSPTDLLEALERLGLVDGVVFGKMISGKLPIESISEVSNVPNLAFMRMPQNVSRAGAVSNQADVAMISDLARQDFQVDGTGVTIGIMSDSYNQQGGEASDIASGDLPSGVVVLDDSAFGLNSDEGRAMAQLIHDIVPGADLIFHTAFLGAAGFAQGILDLAAAGADVIVDDVGNLGQPFFQDGVIAQAVDQVVSDGVVYFSAAGNSADNSYEDVYQDSGQTFDFGSFVLTNLHSFTPGNPADTLQEILLPAGASIRLSFQWDQPFASSGGVGSASDVDIFLVDDTNNIVAFSIEGNLGGDALEILSFTNTTGNSALFGLGVGVFTGPLPGRIKWIDFRGQYTTVTPAVSSATSFGHPNAVGAIAVGAARYDLTPPFGVTPAITEAFSSHGGLEILFDTAGNAITPVDRNKPEIVAPDGSDTSFFGGSDFDNTGFPNFFGTSAAAPHAAAVAALQLQCDSTLTPANVRSGQTNNASDMETAGFDNISGAGLINAYESVLAACSVAQATCNGLAVTVNLNTGVGSPTSGDDVILGTPGDDVIFAFGGNDTICGAGGDDILNAGNGFDWLDAGEGADEIQGGGDDDVLFGGPGDDLIFGGPGNDVIDAGDGDDKIVGNNGDDEIAGGDGVDEISGGNGDDLIFTGAGATVGSGVTVDGGTGNDTIFGGIDADLIRGSGDADSIFGNEGDDQLFGGSGDDLLEGGIGGDLLRGNAGNDTLSGGDGDDNINGFGSRDMITGGAGDDVLNGSTGNDTIDGQEGDDTINGGGGNDNLQGGAGVDLVQGGGGNDVLSGGNGTPDTCDGQAGTDTADASCELLVSVP